MVNWEFLIDENALASVLPKEYGRFARPIRDALTVFLDGLPEEHQAAIMADQATLPASATVSRRLGILARSCPVLQKLGQILARDQRLSAELREQLRELESLPPSVPMEAIQTILDRELGSLDRRGVTLQPPALAEASVAVVVPFQQNRVVAGRQPEQGVFKILKPGIEQRLEQELALMGRVGEYLDQRCDDLQIPHLDYRDSFEQVRDKLHFEIRLDLEQRYLEQARRVYADEPRVQIPRLLDHCTNSITAMERVTGGKVTEYNVGSERDRRQLATLVAKALIAQPIFARNNQALFHGDPHAGNLFITDDQRLAILDWSLAGSLGDRERIAIVQIMLAAVTLRPARIVTVLEGLAERHQVDRPALTAVAQAALRRIRHGQFPGLTWLIGLLDDAVQTARLRVATDLMLFRKTLHTLEGVLADLGSDSGQIDRMLCLEFSKHFAVEWPGRWFAPPFSRGFATRLSNADLTHTMLSIPSTATRFWRDQGLDVLRRCAEKAKTQVRNGT